MAPPVAHRALREGLNVAPEVYKNCLILIGIVILIGGVFDLGFWLQQELTISEWLKENPAWFIVPAALILAFLTLLGVHLFVLPPHLGGVQ